MHKHDLWAGVNSQVIKRRRLRTWMFFRDCLKLHNLTVFSADAAERQRFYNQQAVRKPWRATVQQHISQMGVSSDHVRHLPTLKDSSKTVPTMKKGNIPFSKADLAAIVLAFVPMLWQNQYNLNHSTIPKSTCTFLLDLEAIKGVMVEKRVARHTAILTRLTPWTAVATTAMVSPLRQQQVRPLSPRSPTRSLGVIRAWPSCRPCLRLMQKARRNEVSLRSARSGTMTPVTVPTVNSKLGTATRD
jgi:hypothetical protein